VGPGFVGIDANTILGALFQKRIGIYEKKLGVEVNVCLK
jgi:hypothetical protein